jgi:hypothetical protein
VHIILALHLERAVVVCIRWGKMGQFRFSLGILARSESGISVFLHCFWHLHNSNRIKNDSL